ncbi:MAG: hypothetical protein Q8L87_00790, partial [Anaerolineales bacterium]|nr:hypothetical protein [Anaerolineales bacterium]
SPWSRKRAISAKSTPLGLLYLRGRVELATENKDEAHQTLSKALALSDSMGAHRKVREMCWALSQLEAERGNGSIASQLKERACNEVKLIAEHAGTPELRESFLSQVDVQLVLNAP